MVPEYYRPEIDLEHIKAALRRGDSYIAAFLLGWYSVFAREQARNLAVDHVYHAAMDGLYELKQHEAMYGYQSKLDRSDPFVRDCMYCARRDDGISIYN